MFCAYSLKLGESAHLGDLLFGEELEDLEQDDPGQEGENKARGEVAEVTLLAGSG